MDWKIEYDSRVLREMKNLDRNVQQQILDYFDEHIEPSQNPRKYGKELKSHFSGLWRYSIGNYRAICQIDDENLSILVVRVGHQNKVYEKPL